jgi:tetratricopeptide (TPR) repeat protein
MILCQKCGTINQVGDEACSKCGTRLMIITNLYPGDGPVPIWEEHFLERISALEHQLNRLEDRLNEVLQVIQHVATESFYDHSMIETIVDVLKKNRLSGTSDMETVWQRRVSRRIKESEERERLELCKQSFLGAFRGKERGAFVKKVEESTEFFLHHNFQKGLKSLEMAYAVDPHNAEIGLFLGKIHYGMRRFASAGKYLFQVLKENPQHFEANLLSGLLARRNKNYTKAKGFLHKALDCAPLSPVACLAMGDVLLAMGEEKEALHFLSKALELKPIAQLHLVLGAIFSRQGNLRAAARHIKKAIETDPRNDEAFFHLGMVFLAQNRKVKAAECFKTACRLNPRESRFKAALRRDFSGVTPPLPDLWQEMMPRFPEEKIEGLVEDELHLDFLMKKTRQKRQKGITS